MSLYARALNIVTSQMGAAKQLKRTTNKKQRQELKAARKQQNQKTQQERAAEVNDIKASLSRWELSDRYEAVAQLYAHLDHFVETGESASGKIPFPECPPPPHGRMIVYKFTNVRGQKGTCDLMVRNGQEYYTNHARRDLPVVLPE